MSNNILEIEKFLTDFNRNFLGYSNLITSPRIQYKRETYPPSDYVQISDSEYELRVAVAGFSDKDVKVEFDPKNSLIKISGSKENKSDEKYIFKGIAQRGFDLEYSINPNLKVENVKLKDGILTVFMKHIVPDDEKPKLLTIQTE